MSTNPESKIREVSIVKRVTTMTSEEFFSIQLKAPDESVESLLKKAMMATNLSQPTKTVKLSAVA